MLAIRLHKVAPRTLPPHSAAFILAVLCLCLSVPLRASEWVYTVVEGDNLWTFSETHLDSVMRFEELRRINNITSPTRMQPGTRIRVPMDWIPRSQPIPAVIESVNGIASVRRATGERSSASAGTSVHLGDRVRTDRESSAAIRFADDSVVTLHADSEIRFDQLSAYGTTGMVDSRFKLMDGRLDTRVTPSAGPGSRFEIHTPSAISAVRGTEYRVSADDATTNIEVLEGGVAVSGQDAEELVAAGFGTRVEQGGAPIAPRELLPAPALRAVPERVEALALALRWRANGEATGYRVELSDSAAFDTIAWQERTTETSAQMQFEALSDGIYHYRVRSIDDIGLEGLPAVGTLELDARPFPPAPSAPGDGAVLTATTPELQWAAVTDAESYRVQVATDAGFENVIIDRDGIKGTSFSDRRMKATGDYHWRVDAVDSAGDSGPSGSSQSFSVRPKAKKPRPAIELTYEGKRRVSWTPDAEGFTYQIQVARDRGFRDLALNERGANPDFLIDANPDEPQFVRVRAIADGYKGPWSDRKRVKPALSKHTWFIPIAALLVLIGL